jgi:hypothetical protein
MVIHELDKIMRMLGKWPIGLLADIEPMTQTWGQTIYEYSSWWWDDTYRQTKINKLIKTWNRLHSLRCFSFRKKTTVAFLWNFGQCYSTYILAPRHRSNRYWWKLPSSTSESLKVAIGLPIPILYIFGANVHSGCVLQLANVFTLSNESPVVSSIFTKLHVAWYFVLR